MPEAPAAPAADAQVRVVDKYGVTGSIPASQLQAALAQGYTMPTAPAEKSVAEDAAARGFGPVASRALQVASPLLTAQQGILGGATAGLTEGIQRKIAGVIGPVAARMAGGPEMTAEEAEDYYKYLAQGGAHSGIHTGAELTGMVGGAVAAPYLKGAGAAGTVGRGLGLIGEAGAGAASGAKALTGALAARGALGRAGAAAIEHGVRGATELAIYDGVKELNEEAFGKPELSAEKIFAAAADGALGGAVFGGTLGAGGSLVKSGAKGAASIAKDFATKNADTFEKFANEQRWRALDPLKKYTKEAEARIEGGVAEVGARMKKRGVFDDTFSGAAREGGVEQLAPKIDAATEQVGREIGETIAASPATVPWGKIEDGFESVVKDLRKKGGFDGIVNSLEAYKESLAAKIIPEAELAAQVGAGGAVKSIRDVQIPLQDAVFQRRALDDLVYKESKALDPNLRVGFLRDFRSKFEGAIVDSFDEAAAKTGDVGAKARLLDLKKDYQALSLARDAAEDSVSRMATNRQLSISDYISGGALSSIGTAIAGPVGGLAGGALGAAVNKFARSRGNAIAAVAGDRLAAFGRQGLTAKIAEAVPALEREAALIDGSAVRAAEGPAEKPLVAATEVAGPKLTFQPAMTPDWVERLGIERGQTHEELAKFADEIFGGKMPTPEALQTMWRTPAGYGVKLGQVMAFTEKGRPNFLVEATITGPGGNDIGEMARTFSRDADGKLFVKHNNLSLEPEFQGKGIGSELSKSAIDSYKQMGVDRIELIAGDSAGPYVWARRGFDWAPGAQEKMAKKAAAFGDPEVAAAIERGPRAVSEAARGKEFLLGAGEWRGQMSLKNADMLDKVAQFDRAQTAVRKLDTAIESAAQGIVSPPKTVVASKRRFGEPKTLQGKYEAAVDAVASLQENTRSILERATSGVEHMPKVQQAIGMQTIRVMNYLAAGVPAPLEQPVLGRSLPTVVSDADMHAFVQKYEIARNPMSALREFEKGRMTQLQATALKVVSPEIFAQLQASALRIVASRQEAGKPLTFDARQRMSTLLGVQTDPSQSPKMKTSLQTNVRPSTGPGGSGGGPKKSGGPVKPQDQGTALQQLETK